MFMKTCSKCGIEKEESCFYIKTGTANLISSCKDCNSIRRKEYYNNNKDKVIKRTNKYYKDNKEIYAENAKKYNIDNKEDISKKNKEYREENKEKMSEYQKQYYKDNQEYVSQRAKEYREKNKEKLDAAGKKYSIDNKEKINERNKNRRKTDISYKLRCYVSTAIYDALKANGGSKQGYSIMKYLPYTIEELRFYIEAQFEQWMNWKNHSKYDAENWDDNDPLTWTWNIDHITPKSLFKYASMEEQSFKDCWALSNLRPLSAKQNILDGNRR
jgi:hypothetical protein